MFTNYGCVRSRVRIHFRAFFSHMEFRTSIIFTIENIEWPEQIISISLPSLSEQRNSVAAVSCRNYFRQTWFDETDLRVVSAGRNTSLTSSSSSPLDKSIPGFVSSPCVGFSLRTILRFFTFEVITRKFREIASSHYEPQLYARHYVVKL